MDHAGLFWHPPHLFPAVQEYHTCTIGLPNGFCTPEVGNLPANPRLGASPYPLRIGQKPQGKVRVRPSVCQRILPCPKGLARNHGDRPSPRKQICSTRDHQTCRSTTTPQSPAVIMSNLIHPVKTGNSWTPDDLGSCRINPNRVNTVAPFPG